MRTLPVSVGARRRRGTLDDLDRLAAGPGWPGPGWSSRRRPGLRPALVERLGFGGHGHGLRLLAGQVQQRRQHAGVGTLPLEQRAEDDLQDVRDLAQEGAGLLGRLGRRVLQHHGQVVGQLARRQEEAGRFVGLDQVDHGRAAVAAVAVHVLEQVQRGAAAAVEQLDIIGFDLEGVPAVQPIDERVEFGQAAEGQRTLVVQRGAQLGQVGAQFGVGVAQQVRQHRQVGVEGPHIRPPP
jgi:hypothetical protein